MIRQLVALVVLSLLASILMVSQKLAILKATGEGFVSLLGYLLGSTLTLIILSIAIAAIPRLFYWLTRKKRAPDYFVSVWSIWILLIVLMTFSHVYDNFYKNIEQPKLDKSTAQVVYKKVVNSVYVIFGIDKNDKAISSGSAVAVTSDFLATNCHIINNADHFTIFVNKKEQKGILYSRHDDICIVTIQNPQFIPIEIRPSKSVEIGENAYAVGNPEGYFIKTISDGIISNKYNLHGNTIIQTNAALSHGSSGGGLFDQDGKLIGITSYGYTEDNAQNINFVLPTEIIEAAILEPTPNETAEQNKVTTDLPKKTPAQLKSNASTYEILGVYGGDDVILASTGNSCFIAIIGRYNPQTITSVAVWMPEVPNGLLIFSRVTQLKNVVKFMSWMGTRDNIKVLTSKSFIFHDEKLEPLGIYSIDNVLQPVYVYSSEKPITEELIVLDHFVAQFYDYDQEGNGGMTSIEFGLDGFTEALGNLNKLCR